MTLPDSLPAIVTVIVVLNPTPTTGLATTVKSEACLNTLMTSDTLEAAK